MRWSRGGNRVWASHSQSAACKSATCGPQSNSSNRWSNPLFSQPPRGGGHAYNAAGPLLHRPLPTRSGRVVRFVNHHQVIGLYPFQTSMPSVRRPTVCAIRMTAPPLIAGASVHGVHFTSVLAKMRAWVSIRQVCSASSSRCVSQTALHPFVSQSASSTPAIMVLPPQWATASSPAL